MNAEELRIGNWVNVIKKVPVQITAKHIVAISEGDKQYTDIPLTEEWVLKLGFKKDEITKQLALGGIEICGTDDSGYSLCEDDGYILIGKPCKYVHQLQNLYFALTGEELIINSKEKTRNID